MYVRTVVVLRVYVKLRPKTYNALCSYTGACHKAYDILYIYIYDFLKRNSKLYAGLLSWYW